jgi:hypothetical protein
MGTTWAGQWKDSLRSAPAMTMHPVKNDDSDESDGDHERASFDGGDGGGYDGSMRERIAKLEAFATETFRRLDRLGTLAERHEIQLSAAITRLDGINAKLESVASKQDLMKQEISEFRLAAKRDIDNAIKWIVGVMLAISMAAITIITFVLNYATPKAGPASPQPIVIYATAPPATPIPAPPP